MERRMDAVKQICFIVRFMVDAFPIVHVHMNHLQLVSIKLILVNVNVISCSCGCYKEENV